MVAEVKKVKRKKRSKTVPLPKGVTQVGDIVPYLMVKYGLQQHRNIERIETVWCESVGAEFASFSRVRSVSRGTLEIAVPHNALIQELSFRKDALLLSMQTALPEERIKRLKFVVN
jgi:predicted nucleic acid-binding Zn ribbon protein